MDKMVDFELCHVIILHNTKLSYIFFSFLIFNRKKN